MLTVTWRFSTTIPIVGSIVYTTSSLITSTRPNKPALVLLMEGPVLIDPAEYPVKIILFVSYF
jgi:hypothetical protein